MVSDRNLLDDALDRYYEACAYAIQGDVPGTTGRLYRAVHDAWQELEGHIEAYVQKRLVSLRESGGEKREIEDLIDIQDREDWRSAIKSLPLSIDEKNGLHIVKHVRDYQDHIGRTDASEVENLSTYLRRLDDTRYNGRWFDNEQGWKPWIEDFVTADNAVLVDASGVAHLEEVCKTYANATFPLLRLVRKALGKIVGDHEFPKVPVFENVSKQILNRRALLEAIPGDPLLRLKAPRSDEPLAPSRFDFQRKHTILVENSTLPDLVGNEYQMTLLLGESGMGKSASLAFVTLQQAERALEADQRDDFTPIFVDLRDYVRRFNAIPSGRRGSGSGIGTSLARLGITAFLAGVGVREELVPLILKQERWVIVMDGLDEALRPESARDVLCSDLATLLEVISPSSRVIVACRTNDFEAHRDLLDITLGTWQTVSMAEIEDDDIQRYLQLDDKEFEDMSHDLRVECANTFFLYLLRQELGRETRSISISNMTVTGLFELFVQHQLNSKAGDRWKNWRDVLSEMAFEMERSLQLRAPVSYLGEESSRGLGDLYADSPELLEEHTWSPGLIRKVGPLIDEARSERNARSVEFEFIHPRIQSYLASRRAAQEWNSKPSTAMPFLEMAALSEALPHVASQVRDPENFISWLASIEPDPPLLGRCLRFAGEATLTGELGRKLLTSFFRGARIGDDNLFRPWYEPEEMAEPHLEALRVAAGRHTIRLLREIGAWPSEREVEYVTLRIAAWADEDEAWEVLSSAVDNIEWDLDQYATQALQAIASRGLTRCMPALFRLTERLLRPDEIQQQNPYYRPRGSVELLRAVGGAIAACESAVEPDMIETMFRGHPLSLPLQLVVKEWPKTPEGRKLLSRAIMSTDLDTRDESLQLATDWFKGFSLNYTVAELVTPLADVLEEERLRRERLIDAIETCRPFALQDLRSAILLGVAGTGSSGSVLQLADEMMSDASARRQWDSLFEAAPPKDVADVPLDALIVWFFKCVSKSILITILATELLAAVDQDDGRRARAVEKDLDAGISPQRASSYWAVFCAGIRRAAWSASNPPRYEVATVLEQAANWGEQAAEKKASDPSAFDAAIEDRIRLLDWLPPYDYDPATVYLAVCDLIRQGDPDCLSYVERLEALPRRILGFTQVSYPHHLYLAAVAAGHESSLALIVQENSTSPTNWRATIDEVVRSGNGRLAAQLADLWARDPSSMASELPMLPQSSVESLEGLGFFDAVPTEVLSRVIAGPTAFRNDDVQLSALRSLDLAIVAKIVSRNEFATTIHEVLLNMGVRLTAELLHELKNRTGGAGVRAIIASLNWAYEQMRDVLEKAKEAPDDQIDSVHTFFAVAQGDDRELSDEQFSWVAPLKVAMRVAVVSSDVSGELRLGDSASLARDAIDNFIDFQPYDEVVAAAIKAVANIEGEGALELIERIWQRERQRRACVQALAIVGTRRAADFLESSGIIEGAAADVRLEARRAVIRIRQRSQW